MKIHLNDPYKCDRCGKIFENSNNQYIGIFDSLKPMQPVDLCPNCIGQLCDSFIHHSYIREWLNLTGDDGLDSANCQNDIPNGLIPGLPGYPPRRPKK